MGLGHLIGEAGGGDPPTTALAFVVGGVVAIIVSLVRARLADGDQPPAEDAVTGEVPDRMPGLSDVVTSDLGIWSLVRAVLTIVAVVIGYQRLTGGLDPFWVAIPLLIVLIPDREGALFKAAQRGIGTFVGVLSGVNT